MPKKIEEALIKEAKKKHLWAKRLGAYVYWTLRKMWWKPKKK